MQDQAPSCFHVLFFENFDELKIYNFPLLSDLGRKKATVSF